MAKGKASERLRAENEALRQEVARLLTERVVVESQLAEVRQERSATQEEFFAARERIAQLERSRKKLPSFVM